VTELVVLLAHGSPDPRSAHAVCAIAQTYSATHPDVLVRVAYLQHNWPTLSAAVGRELDTGEVTGVRVQPLLLSAATHALRDVPNAVAKAERDHRMSISVGEPLGMDPSLIPGIDTGIPPGAPIVLAWAGGRTNQAQFAAQSLAAEWGRTTGREVALAAASDDGSAIAAAVAALREATGLAPHVVTFTLFPGVIADQVRDAADACGVQATAPLCELPALLTLIEMRLIAKPLDGTATA
jgi:sirohydrochlorin ferrochelatase